MSAPSGVLEAQLRSLLELIEQRRAEECARIEAEAREERKRILGQAHREARQRMHAAIATERKRSEQQIESARARLHTRSRQHRHHLALLMLHRGWEVLREALVARWRNPETQEAWCDNLLHEAEHVLPRGLWVVEHPTGWSDATANRFSRLVREVSGKRPTLSPDEGILAGLRICTQAACIDGTVGQAGAGLLADREEAEARLLAHLHHLLAKRQEARPKD